VKFDNNETKNPLDFTASFDIPDILRQAQETAQDPDQSNQLFSGALRQAQGTPKIYQEIVDLAIVWVGCMLG
jgi:hypothetical protein